LPEAATALDEARARAIREETAAYVRGLEASAAEPNPNSLVPIVLAARDLPAGSAVTWGDLTQSSIPADQVSSSVIKPDAASYIDNQKLLLPVLAGDPMQWSFFEIRHGELLDPCEKLSDKDTVAEQQVVRARQIVLLHGR
jgi:Flp pilus assembly protein CpaB